MHYSDLLAAVYLLVGVLTALLGLVILRENSGARLNRVIDNYCSDCQDSCHPLTIP